MKTKLSFLELLEAKAGVSLEPVVFVPAHDSNPQFFYSATSRTRPVAVAGPVATEMKGSGFDLGIQTVPVLAVKIQNGKAALLVKTFGLN